MQQTDLIDKSLLLKLIKYMVCVYPFNIIYVRWYGLLALYISMCPAAYITSLVYILFFKCRDAIFESMKVCTGIGRPLLFGRHFTCEKVSEYD